MPAIQTYEAQGIRPGYNAQRGEHKGTVQDVRPAPVLGALNIRVHCAVHGRPETWKNVPRHAAVHAERVL